MDRHGLAVNKFTFVRVADLFRHVCFHHLVLHLFVINAVFSGNIEAFLTWLRDGDWTALLDHLLFATHGLIGCTLQNQEKKILTLVDFAFLLSKIWNFAKNQFFKIGI